MSPSSLEQSPVCQSSLAQSPIYQSNLSYSPVYQSNQDQSFQRKITLQSLKNENLSTASDGSEAILKNLSDSSLFSKDFVQKSLVTEPRSPRSSPTMKAERRQSNEACHYYVEVDARKSTPPLIELSDVMSNPEELSATHYTCPRKKTSSLKVPKIPFPKTKMNTNSAQILCDVNRSERTFRTTSINSNEQDSSTEADGSLVPVDENRNSHGSTLDFKIFRPFGRVPVPKQRSRTENLTESSKSEIDRTKEGADDQSAVHHVSEWRRDVERLVRVEPFPVVTSSVQCDIVSMETVAKSDNEIQKLRVGNLVCSFFKSCLTKLNLEIRGNVAARDYGGQGR